METNHGYILLAEDDTNLGYLIVENLKSKGFEVVLAKDGHAALAALEKQKLSLCILDIMLPGIDGLSVATQIKRRYPALPFIFLTARNMEQDKLHGFEIGADDYITKPFSFKELYYRIMAILRRVNPIIETTAAHAISLGEVTLYPTERILEIRDVRKKLSQREAVLFLLLLQQNGMYISRSEILKRIWGNDDYFTAKSMDVYITRIRKLLKDTPGIEVENLYGVGYRIKCLG